jgi:cytochrome c biogenesis protein CcmG/thiol:disulfide interchange protein DsbE
MSHPDTLILAHWQHDENLIFEQFSCLTYLFEHSAEKAGVSFITSEKMLQLDKTPPLELGCCRDMRSIYFLLLVVGLYPGAEVQPQSTAPLGSRPVTISALAAPDRFKGKHAPEFELKVVNGKGRTLKLSSLEGKAVLVNFWATWCEPCKIEMPWLVRLQKKYRDQGLQIVGVAVDSPTEEAISDFAHKMHVNYPVVLGTDEVAGQYGGIEGLPKLFFINRSGTIVRHDAGLTSESILEEHVKECLGPANALTSSGR